MVSLQATIARILAAFSVASFMTVNVASIPVNETLEVRAAAATPAAPHWVAYSDEWVSGENGPPATSSITGFNVFILSFLLLSGPADQALEWTLISAADRASIKSAYTAAGIKLLVSAFGSTDVPTTSGADPVKTANTMAAWVKQYNLDGIDVDYEDFGAFETSGQGAVAWLNSFTKQLRAQLPQGTYIITHAPVAPWFQNNRWPDNGYLAVDKAVGSLIDWYNVQFYNQGTSQYTTCTNLLTKSGGSFPSSSVFEINAAGVPLSKIVIGKPATAGTASNGFMSTSTLAGCVSTAKSQGWNAGVMTWEFPEAGTSWIKTVRGSAWPV